MRGGDISNESPPRLIVFVDSVVNYEMTEERVFLAKRSTVKITALNNPALSHLWRMADMYGMAVELAGCASDGWTQEHLDYVMDRLERRGGNPFNYAELYPTLQDFIDELPYRANLKGVISREPARFGSWGIELQNL